MSSQRSPDGAEVGAYRLEERLGAGGGGQVYRARHMRTGAAVALKLLRDPGSLATMERVIAVRHPNLVRVLETFAAPAGACVVLEHLDGTTLGPILARRGPLAVEVAVAVLLPVLDALHAAHAAGLVHGDLTPENVFLERLDGGGARIKLLDLGGVPQTDAGDAVFGSAAHLSPEQAAGEALDARSDVFGAGLLLYELVTGHPAFEAPGPVAAAYAILHAPAPRAADPRLRPVLDVALAKSPADRFPGAGAFAAALAALPLDPALSAAALSALGAP